MEINANRSLRIALSLCGAPNTDANGRDFGTARLDALCSILCQVLLGDGHTLAFGGEPVKNFTAQLGEIERCCRMIAMQSEGRLLKYVAGYLHTAPAFQNDLHDVMKIVQVASAEPAAAMLGLTPLLDLTTMRKRMLSETDVRIVAAGELLPGGQGSRRGPGVLEEAYLSIKASQPLLVIGGFSGAGGLIADALRGRCDDAVVGRLRTHFATRDTLGRDDQSDFDEMLSVFTPTTPLHNALSEAENLRLATSTDPDELAALVVLAVHRLTK